MWSSSESSAQHLVDCATYPAPPRRWPRYVPARGFAGCPIRVVHVRAVVYDRYGAPDVLRVEEVPMPRRRRAGARRVAATSINLSDWECLRGSPLYARIGGLRSPARRRSARTSPGGSTPSAPASRGFARRRGVRRQPGAEGWLRRVRVAPESALAHKPPELTFVRGVGAPPGRSDRAARNGAAYGGTAGADQRGRWRLGLVRDPVGQAARRSRDRRRQRRQARLHALARARTR